MELSAYISLFRRWLWLIVLAAVVGGTASFITARVAPPSYQATVTIQVGTYSNLANPSAGMIQTAEQLAQTYVVLSKAYPLLDAVINKLQLGITTDQLASRFVTRQVSGTSLLTITVTYSDPVIAADIANELANQLIASSPTQLTKEQQSQLQILQREIEQAGIELQTMRDELKAIEASLGQLGPQEQAILTARRAELATSVSTTQANLAQMTKTAADLQQEGNANSLKVVEPSRIPEAAAASSVLVKTLTAAMVGAVLALGFAFLVEYLNNTIRTPSEVMPLLSIPLIGTITPFGKKNTYKDKLIAWTEPRSAISESYRALRVNLTYRTNEEGSGDPPLACRSFIVTSPGPGEGKSVSAANLAVTFALTGARVLLVDFDLRRPTQHELFGIRNNNGLSAIWGTREVPKRIDNSPTNDASPTTHRDVQPNIQLFLSHMIQKSQIKNLEILPAGTPISNPSQLLDTPEIRSLIAEVVSSGQYDVVVYDTPPVLVVADTNIIANLTKASILLVLQSGKTNRGSAVRAIEQLSTLWADVVGVILNRLNPRDIDSGYGQYYYSYDTKYTPDRKQLDNTVAKASANGINDTSQKAR